MTEQERAELERLKAALRQVNENSGYGSDATFTTRLVFRAAVLLYWHAAVSYTHLTLPTN